MIVAQSIPKERYAAGEKGPALGRGAKLAAVIMRRAGSLPSTCRNTRSPPAPEQSPSTAEGAGDPPLFPDDEEGAP